MVALYLQVSHTIRTKDLVSWHMDTFQMWWHSIWIESHTILTKDLVGWHRDTFKMWWHSIWRNPTQYSQKTLWADIWILSKWGGMLSEGIPHNTHKRPCGLTYGYFPNGVAFYLNRIPRIRRISYLCVIYMGQRRRLGGAVAAHLFGKKNSARVLFVDLLLSLQRFVETFANTYVDKVWKILSLNFLSLQND